MDEFENETNNSPQFEEVEIKKENYEIVDKEAKYKRTDSYFDGGVIELIGYRILGFLVTILTLGIARSWAICMIIRYKVNHTVLNGKRLRFEGKGSGLFVERLKWLILTIITLGIYGLWRPVKMLKWEVSQIHFEDEDFLTGESYFDAGLLKLIGINILCFLVTLLTLGIAYPVAECMKLKWIAKHTIINRKKIVFEGSGVSLFLHRLLWTLLTCITFGIFGLWLTIMHLKFYVKHTHIKTVGEEEKKDLTDLIVLFVFVVVGIFFAFIISNSVLKSISPTNNDEIVNKIEESLNVGAEEVIELIKQRNDTSAGATDYVNTLSSMDSIVEDGLNGIYYYSTTTFIKGLDYDIVFKISYKGYYCEKYISANANNPVECHSIFETKNNDGDKEVHQILPLGSLEYLIKYIQYKYPTIFENDTWYNKN